MKSRKRPSLTLDFDLANNAITKALVSTIFTRMPKPQNVKDGFVNLIAHFIIAHENMMHLARRKLIQLFADARMIQQGFRRYRQRLYDARRRRSAARSRPSRTTLYSSISSALMRHRQRLIGIEAFRPCLNRRMVDHLAIVNIGEGFNGH